MCVIIVKKPADNLTKEDFKLFARENKDGWGFVYNDETGTHAVRGMKIAELVKSYGLIHDKEAVLHFRYSTHGKISLENLHPFEVLPGLFLLHNGVFPIECTHDKTRSDTWHFTELVLKPMLAVIPDHDRSNYIRSEAFRYMFETSMGYGNKVVLYDALGPVVFNRSKWAEEAGPKKLLMSNEHPYLYAPLPIDDVSFPYGANKKESWNDISWEFEESKQPITEENFVDFLESLTPEELNEPEWILDNDISPTMLEEFVYMYPTEAAKCLVALVASASLYSNSFYD